jgi:hypothetical protein
VIITEFTPIFPIFHGNLRTAAFYLLEYKNMKQDLKGALLIFATMGALLLFCMAAGGLAVVLFRLDEPGRRIWLTLTPSITPTSTKMVATLAIVVPSAAAPARTSTPLRTTPFPILPSTTPIPGASAGPTYTNKNMGLTLQYPSGWKFLETKSSNSVIFSTPDAAASPSAYIQIDYYSDQSTNPQRPASVQSSSFKAVTVAGLNGIYYEDNPPASAIRSAYYELLYRTGMLLVTVTRGPQVDLLPQFQEMAKTIKLAP